MLLDIIDLGLVPYQSAWDLQVAVHGEVSSGARPSTVLLVEHPPVITMGASFRAENLLRSPEELKSAGIELVRTDRGGDVTYHAPGQLVAYPIVDLSQWGPDLHEYLRALEAAVIQVSLEFGVVATRNPVNTGVWVSNRKLCAIGIKVKRWVTLHGLALNCNLDLSGFFNIIPCGIGGEYGVTSLAVETKQIVSPNRVKPHLIQALQAEFSEPLRTRRNSR